MSYFAPSSPTTTNIPTLNVNQALLLPKLRAGIARVRAGTGSCRFGMIGDSTTRGHGALGNPNTGNYNYAVAAYLSRMFGGLPQINAHNNSAYGYVSLTTDARLTATGSFSTGTGGNSLGGAMFLANAAGKLSFTPTVNTDTVEVYYYQGIAGSFTLDTNGGTATTTTIPTTPAQMQTAVIATGAAAAANTYNLNWVSGSNFICGVRAYDSSKKWLEFDNWGFEGSQTVNWISAGAAYNPINAAVAIAPEVISICLGINDWDNGISVATYTANVQALITAAQATSDVILISPNPSQPGFVAGTPSIAGQQTYVTALASLAASNNALFIDNFSRWVSYASSNALGYNFDGLHPNSVGYEDLAVSIFDSIRP